MTVLVIAESNGKVVDRGTLSAITAAKKIDNAVDMILFDESQEVIDFSRKILNWKKFSF